jgi:hypothetical protein
MEALAIIIASQASRELSQSALPHAPVVPPEPPRPARTRPLRRATATALHRLADIVEPCVTPAGRPAVH